VKAWRWATVAVSLFCAGCAVPHVTEQTLFRGTLEELAPHRPGDRFVYRVTGTGDRDGIYVEELSATGKANEFDVTLHLAQNDSPTLITRLRNHGDSMAIVSEELSTERDLGFAYESSIPYLSVPVRTGVQEASSAATLWRLSDGRGIADGHVKQTTTVPRPTKETAGGEIEIRRERNLEFPGFSIHLRETSWLRPGLGEVRSESSTNGGPPIYQELLCAWIDGKQIGDCGTLGAKGEEKK